MSEAINPNRRFPWLVILLSIPALAVLISLGTWQVQRLAWKEGLLATIDARLAEAPRPIADVASDMEAGALTQDDVEYLPVQLSGTFDHAGEQFFFATHRGISGYYVYTPIMLADDLQGTTALVNRGFVPFDLKEPEDRAGSQPSGVQTIEGLARKRLDEKPSWAVPENDPVGNIYYWKDLDTMATQAGYGDANADVLPFFIDAGLPTEDYPLGDWPVPGVTIINLPNNHLQYAVTWYGLALTLVGVVGVFVFGRMRGGGPQQPSAKEAAK